MEVTSIRVFQSLEKRRTSFPMIGKALAGVSLFWAVTASAAILDVPAGTTQTISGVHTYDTANIRGTLLLTGNTELTFDWAKQHPEMAATDVFKMCESGIINCDVVAGSNGVAGVSGTTNHLDGTDGTSGTDGQRGYDLKITVWGNAVFSNGSAYIALSGTGGGSGGAGGSGWWIDDGGTRIGGDGGQAGHAGSGGDGGSFTFIVHGDFRTWGLAMIGSYGGAAGSGARGGDGRSPLGVPGLSSAPGRAGDAGSVEIRADTMAGARVQVYLQGGAGGAGASGADSEGPCLPGTAPTDASKGGNGGRINIVTCEVKRELNLTSSGGLGGNGGAGGSTGIGSVCPEVICDGYDGADGSDGGNGGVIEVVAGRVTNLSVTAQGGRGYNGGLGGSGTRYTNASGAHVCGYMGNGGYGGDGGRGGVAIVRTSAGGLASNTAISVTNGLAGGGGAGSLGGGLCPAGTAGSAGVPGAASVIVRDTLPGGDLYADVQVDRATARSGELLDFTVNVRAFDSVRNNVLITLPVPSNSTLVCATEGYSLIGNTLQWSVSSLDSCEALMITQRVVVAAVTSSGNVVSNSARVSATGVSEFATTSAVTRILYESLPQYGKQQDIPYYADPVHPGLGNVVCSRSLITIASPTLPVILEATYNSLDGSRGGALGYGWNHTYDACLTQTVNTVRLKLGGGEQLQFQTADGTNFSPVACATRMTLRKPATNQYEATQYNGVKYIFDGQGRLTRLQDPNGKRVDLTYSTQLDRVTDTAGRRVDFTWQTGRIASITLVPISRSVSFGYDASSNLISITDLRGYTNRFSYDSQHRMITEIDARGSLIVSNVYDATGRVVRQVNALGRETTFTYYDVDSAGLRRVDIAAPGGATATHYYDDGMNVQSTVDPVGQTAAFTYDNRGRRVTSTDKKSNQGVFGYDASGNPTTLADRAGGTTHLGFDLHARVTSIEDGTGAAFTMGVNSNGNLTSTEDPLGNDRQLACNAAGQPETISDPLNKDWHITYNATGQMQTVSDPLGNTVTYEYDVLGRMISESQPGNAAVKTRLAFDAVGNLTNSLDFMSNQTVRTYDPNGNLQSVTFVSHAATTVYGYNALNQVTNIVDAMGGVTTIRYDAAGRVMSVTDPDGVRATFSYDPSGRLVAQVDGTGQRASYFYDANGNLTLTTNQLGRLKRFAYDNENRLIETTDALGNHKTIAYDARGRVLSLTDELGGTQTRAYDALGRITRTTAADGGSTWTEYDGNGNVTRLTDALGHSWEYEYDDAGRMTECRDPKSVSEYYGYNARGLMTQKTTRDSKIYTYGYDLAGHVTSVTLPDGAGTVTYAYDGAGNLTNAADPYGFVSMTYDKLNRRTSFTDRNTNTLQYLYTAGGRLAAVIYPGNRAVTNLYDLGGRLTNVTDWTGRKVGFQYDVLSRVTNMVLPNASKKSFSYDVADRIVSLRHVKSSGAVLENIQLGYDAAGRLTRRTRDTTGLVGSVTSGYGRYVYDEANRIATRVADGVTNTYAFDARGNLISKTVGGLAMTFRYDALNRLIMTSNSSLVVSNTYDASGNRFAQRVNGTETRALTDGGRTYIRYNAAGGVDRYCVYAGPVMYSLDASSNLLVFHDDERGSVVDVTDTNQAVVQTYAYSPYGRLMAGAGTVTNVFLFGGAQGTVADTNGLLLMRARYYDPDAARFITEDPLRLAAGLNLYAYANGDPIGRIDPQGLADGSISLPQKVLPPPMPSKFDPQFSYAGVKSMQQQILGYEAELKRTSEWGEYWLKQGNVEAASESVAKAQQYEQGIANLESDLYKQAPALKNVDWRASTPYKYSSLYNTLPELGEETVEKFSFQNFAGNVGRGIYRNASGVANAIKDEITYYLTVGSVPVGAYLEYLMAQGARVAILEGGAVAVVLTVEGVVVYAVTEEAMKETGADQAVIEFIEAGLPMPDNTVNLSVYYHQKYKKYYDSSDRCDQKIQQIREMGLLSIP